MLLIAVAVAGPFLSLLSFAAAPSKSDLQCRYLTSIEEGFLLQHVKYEARGKDLQDRVVDQYLKKIDASKIYLLQSDVDNIKKMMSSIFDKMKAKDCSALAEAQKILVERVKERAQFAKDMLGKNYKFDFPL